MTMQGIFQNRIILGVISALIVLSGVLFILQPTKVSAQASMRTHRDKNGIAIFGNVSMTNGDPVEDVDLTIGAKKTRHWHEKTKIFDRDTTDSKGNYKLWVSNSDMHQLKGRDMVFAVKPDKGSSYEQVLDLESGDIASITIQMRTPVVPIFPFTIFVY